MTCQPHSVQVSSKEDSIKELDHPERVVGQTSENVEADRAVGSIVDASDRPSTWQSVCDTAKSTPRVVVTPTMPKVPIKTEIEIKQETESVHDLDTVYGTYDEATNSITIIYPGEENCMSIQECVQEVSADDIHYKDDGTYLTTTHCYPPQFSPAYTCRTDTMSPVSIHSEDVDNGVVSTKLDYASLSDGGYESHDSPCTDSHRSSSNVALTDLWHESFTELFPMLA